MCFAGELTGGLNGTAFTTATTPQTSVVLFTADSVVTTRRGTMDLKETVLLQTDGGEFLGSVVPNVRVPPPSAPEREGLPIPADAARRPRGPADDDPGPAHPRRTRPVPAPMPGPHWEGRTWPCVVRADDGFRRTGCHGSLEGVMTMLEALAHAMFERRCELDGAQPELAELAWEDEEVRRFWVAEANYVIEVLNRLDHPGVPHRAD